MFTLVGVLFVLSTQPMMVISSLILAVLFYSLLLYWNMSGFWFSYMMILVLMSGVLVVFTYMMSILPNESFEVSSLVLVVLGTAVFLKYSGAGEYTYEVSLGSTEIWGGSLMSVSVFLVVYLLMMMVMTVWVSMMDKGAIRISWKCAWLKG